MEGGRQGGRLGVGKKRREIGREEGEKGQKERERRGL